jgi:hypothetical protein
MLEMESGYGVICNQFEGEVSNNFYERGIGEGVMAILTSIFITCDATLESLLNHPYFSVLFILLELMFLIVVYNVLFVLYYIMYMYMFLPLECVC